MTKINKFLTCMLVSCAMFLAMTSCNKDLQDDVNDIKNRITTLEESVAQLDQAIKNGKLITSVDPVAPTSTTPGGWLITFSDKSAISINDGKKGDTGDTGATGPQGQTPYIWINAAGNWASNLGSKPVDADDAKYEIKHDGISVKARGVSVRVINEGGFIAFEEYDATGYSKKTVTNFPYDHGEVITAIHETTESVTITIKDKSYCLAKAGIYPTSITVIRDKDYVIKGGTVSFDIAVNPANSKTYAKEDFSLDYEMEYMSRAYGLDPDFIKIKSVVPYDRDGQLKGQYKMTLEWKESNTGFAKDAAIFIVLNCTDVEGKLTHIVSSTPVIMNEEYVSIKAANVLEIDDIVMFSDETFTDSVRLSNYHEGYVNTIDYVMTPNPTSAPLAINPLVRYMNPARDKYKFTVMPFAGDNATVWPNGVFVRNVDVVASVVDWGRPAVDPIPARPEIGQPAIPGIPAIPEVTIKEDFKVTVYKVPADNVIFTHDFSDRWLPNATVDYTLTQDNLAAEFGKNGYTISDWNFEIKTQELFLGNVLKPMADNVAPDITKFNASNNFAVSYKLLPTIKVGHYDIVLTITATPKLPRPSNLMQSREFKVKLQVNVVAPKFRVRYRSGHALVKQGSNTYMTYKLEDVKLVDLFETIDNDKNKNVISCENYSKRNDVTPAADPLSYSYVTDPEHGSQGVVFDPYPAVSAPLVSEWGNSSFIKRRISVVVKLNTGQNIPVSVQCSAETNIEHGNSESFVQYNRLNLILVKSQTSMFAGNYSAMGLAGIDISVNKINFTPLATGGTELDPTMIKKINGIVYTAKGNVKCDTGIPIGLDGKQVLQVDPVTGVVTSIKGTTWQNPSPDDVLYQTFTVTYTDIWNNQASTDVNVYVKSKSVPVLP